MTTKTKQAPLHLNRLTIENVMRVKALTVDAEGRHVVLRGANGTGKSTAVTTLWAALKGYSRKAIPEPVTHGEKTGGSIIELGKEPGECLYRIEQRFDSKGGQELILTAGDGSRIGKPRDLLSSLLADFSLDPVAFDALRGQDQVDQVLASAGVKPPVNDVTDITGEPHDPLPDESAAHYLERLSADDNGLYFIRRRELHRIVDQKKAALEEQREQLHKLGGPIQPNETAGTATELLAKMEELQRTADKRRQLQDGATKARREHEEHDGLLKDLKVDLVIQDARISELAQQLEEAKAKAKKTRERIEKGGAVVRELEQEATLAAKEVDFIDDPAPAMLLIREKLQHVEQANAAQAKRQLASEQLDRLAQEAERADIDHKAIDGVLEGLRRLRANLLNGIDLGIQGLEVGMGELRLNGVPLKQASRAQRTRVACCVAALQDPPLKLMTIDNAEHQDTESRAELLRIATELGWQVFMCCVDDNKQLTVEIVEGA